MTRDELFAGAIIVTFALLATAHVMLVAGLASTPPRRRALVALVVVPLAPYFGFRAKMAARAGVWVASAVAYVALRLLAS